jgi:hypothetical protein
VKGLPQPFKPAKALVRGLPPLLNRPLFRTVTAERTRVNGPFDAFEK